MSAYFTYQSPRTTEPDLSSLLASLRGADATAGLQHEIGSPQYTVKKSTVWTPGQQAAVQSLIDTAPTRTPQLMAQATIDTWPIELRALVLLLVDQLNTIRALLPTPLPPITLLQALAALRTKAGTLS